MHIVADENIPLVNEAFSSFGDVRLLPGRSITSEAVMDADVLLVRSITRVNASLLEKSRVSFVATATIGTDHVDTGFLEKQAIAFASAPGSNARSVGEYVAGAIINFEDRFVKPLNQLTIGIIGFGNVGKEVYRVAKALGMRCLLNDPPLANLDESFENTEIKKVLSESDIVTLHVPLKNNGTNATHHLANRDFFKLMKPGAMFMNASRGSVVDERSLLDARKRLGPVVLDVWENEPLPDPSIINLADIATPHIAGYSYNGKLNGTQMIYNAFCKHLKQKPNFSVLDKIKDIYFDINTEPGTQSLKEIIHASYPIMEDDKLFRKITELDIKDRGAYFDLLRKKYRQRYEFSHYRIETNRFENVLVGLGFQVGKETTEPISDENLSVI